MQRLRAIIVDDEPLARERLRGMLASEAEVEVVGECADGNEAMIAIRDSAPDVVFLDIQMPGRDGLQVAAQLPESSRPAIVFTTAHEQFARGAFDVAAVDYLLKPFDAGRLQQALGRAVEFSRSRERGTGDNAAPVAPADPAARRSNRVAFRADGRIVFFRLDEIVWAEADDNYVTLHLANGRLLLRETLTAIEARLGSSHFTRVNRSAIVQTDQIRELQSAMHGNYTVVLRDGTKLPLSRGMRGQLDRFAGG